MSKKDKERAAAAVEATKSHSRGAMDLDELQGPLFVVAALAACVYLMRIADVFGHPAEHAIGIVCWGTMLACTCMRLQWEQQHGNYPMRWGGMFTLVVALMLGLGLLVEVTVASDSSHSQNHAIIAEAERTTPPAAERGN